MTGERENKMYGTDRLKCLMVKTSLHQFIILFHRETIMSLFKTTELRKKTDIYVTQLNARERPESYYNIRYLIEK